MNIFKMHIGVNLGVQKIASHINGDLLSQEIDYYLNNTITDYIKEQYSLLRDNKGDLQSQYVLDNLQTIIRTQLLEKGQEYVFIPKAKEFQLPLNCEYVVKANVVFDGGKRKECKLIEHSEMDRYVATVTNQPLFRKLPMFIENNKLIIIGDSLDTFDDVIVYITYIRKPAEVKLVTENNLYDESSSVNCDLPDHTHKSIVDNTIAQILEDLTKFKPQQ